MVVECAECVRHVEAMVMRVEVTVEETAFMEETVEGVLPSIHDEECEPELSCWNAPPVEPRCGGDGILAAKDELGECGRK